MTGNKKKNSFEQMKSTNVEKVYHAILEGHPITRIEIANHIGLNKMTVSNCVKELMEAGIVQEVAQGESDMGRPPIILELNMKYGIFIGIEINILSCKILVTDIAGNILTQKVDRQIQLDPMEFVARVAKLVRSYQKSYQGWEKGVIGVGIALPGNYNYATGAVEYISNMHIWDGFNLQDAFRKSLPDVLVLCQNAGRAGAKGEIHFGKSNASEQLAYVQGAMGLALSIYTNSGIHVGDRGFSGRFGHMIIDVNGRTCICGNQGCLEMYASVNALGRALYPERKIDYACLLEILARKEDGDHRVVDEVRKVAKYLSIGIANIVNCFNPKKVCIGSYLGMLLQNEEMLLNNEVNTMLLEHFRDEHKVFCSGLGEWGAAFGCVAMIREQLIQGF